jgi:hypothetical protein
MSCISKTIIFHEAIQHCRWKSVLQKVLKQVKLEEYKTQTFEEIYSNIYLLCNKIKGIGELTIYDIVASICRYHRINIDKVYIIGSGPKRAIKLLKLTTKKHIIHSNIKLNYVDISDIIKSFEKNNFKLDNNLQNTDDGDSIETYICNWQKNY